MALLYSVGAAIEIQQGREMTGDRLPMATAHERSEAVIANIGLLDLATGFSEALEMYMGAGLGVEDLGPKILKNPRFAASGILATSQIHFSPSRQRSARLPSH